jgi:two-component system competent response regulator ComA
VLTITTSERAALQLLAIGSTSGALADRLGMRARDVDAWLAALFAKMGVASRTEALADAVRRGLVTPASLEGNGSVRL